MLGRDELRDGVQLDVGRPLVDGANLGVAVELLDAERLCEADPAEQLDALGRGLLRHLAREQLRPARCELREARLDRCELQRMGMDNARICST